MNNIKVRPILVPYNIHEIQPKDCIGKIFLNENYVATILNDLEDIIKSNAYFNAIPQQLILISLDPNEKIETGDLLFNIIDKTFHKVMTDEGADFYSTKAKYAYEKVIATQDQLSPELIQQLIAEYNNSCMQDFEIEMENYWENYHGVVTVVEKDFCYNKIRPKLNNGFVCIVKKEPILYTEEEIFTLGDKYEEYCINCFGNLPKSFSEWFNQNKKK